MPETGGFNGNEKSRRRKEVIALKYIFQFCRILAFCFAGEALHFLLPLPIPASIYGLLLLLAALRAGVVRLEQVQATGQFLIAIFPLLFIPAAVGVMELWAELGAMLLPVLLALGPVTVMVMGVSGRVTQGIAHRKEAQRHAHD